MKIEAYPEFLEVKDACEWLGISRPTLINLLLTGELKGFRIGKRKWKIPKENMIAFIQNRCDK
ncbi:MAG TPA: helix-turn-helix domain-containing protein [[Clostridium] spiroforme]|uniref:Helix-turn-helix domain-containing protein n=1 Tax=Thomasclavelia spiroformis TaxID=29348 RepID=A0A921KKJ9_9FIRM|nr:helix-turn-helix domain-containing protein [Thomasclavelia spiroformis]